MRHLACRSERRYFELTSLQDHSRDPIPPMTITLLPTSVALQTQQSLSCLAKVLPGSQSPQDILALQRRCR